MRRSQLIGAIFLLLFFMVIYRFYTLQVVEASWYQEKADEMYSRETSLAAKRGSIYDRYGNILAQEVNAYTAVAVLSEDAPSHVKDRERTASLLAPILDMSEEKLYELLSQDDKYQVELRPGGWKMDRQKMEQIRDLGLEGIQFKEESKRYYPNHVFASHTLGFLNQEGDPVMGLESSLQEYLTGTDGKIEFQTDRNGTLLPKGIEGIKQPQDGNDVYLTLDERIQLYVEQALDEAEEQFAPQGMTVIVSDPMTGEILAMSNRPSFDPNAYSDIENYMNQAVTSRFEPGSTFKTVTLAAAIEEGVFHPNETFLSGSYKVPGGEIRDHRPEGWGEITFLEGVQKSSNVGFAKLGEKLGREKLYQYIYDFGFGQKTGIDLPYEDTGYVIPSERAYPLDVAHMTFGHAITVTAIQQIQMMNAIANGGKLMQPYVIDRIENPNKEEVVLENEPVVLDEQVISSETAAEVGSILETVVTEGTGQNFYIEGYRVAGKTGTAQKVGDNGEYLHGEYIHSFLGFAPVDDPQLSVFVMVDSPQIDEDLVAVRGGAVVAQIFKSVMEQSLQYLSVLPEADEVEVEDDQAGAEPLEEMIEADHYVGSSVMKARDRAEADGFEVIIIGDGAEVVEQSPQSGTPMVKGERIYLLTGDASSMDMPDLTDWTLREVQDWAQMARIELKAEGSGYVVSQSKPSGERIRQGEELIVTLEPKYE